MPEEIYFYDTSSVIKFQFKQYEDYLYNPIKIRSQEKIVKGIITPLVVEEAIHVYYKRKFEPEFKEVKLESILSNIDANFFLDDSTSSQTYSTFRSIVSELEMMKKMKFTGTNPYKIYEWIGSKDVYHLAEAMNKHCSKLITFDKGFQKAVDGLKGKYRFPEIITLD